MDLRAACLVDADLSGANLAGARLIGAIFDDRTLADADQASLGAVRKGISKPAWFRQSPS